MQPTLSEARQKLDEIDRRFIEMLAQRQEVIGEVAALKAASNGSVRDDGRETEMLERLQQLADEAGVPAPLVTDLYERILEHSVRRQVDHLLAAPKNGAAARQITVAYQGASAAYSHLASKRYFAHRDAELTCHGYDSFAAAADAVEAGDADYGMLPIENTTAGSINDTYDLLAERDLHVVGEEIVKVEHCLLAAEPVPLRLIKRIYSHPQAIAQCTDFLSALEGCKTEAYLDTALAAKKVRDEKDPSQAAIASREAARAYDLHVIEEGIANQEANYTRFVVVARAPVSVQKGVPCKTSLLFAVPDEKGALLRCLRIFEEHDLNLTKLESRPRPNAPWSYRFYADVEGRLEGERMQRALEALRQTARRLKVLGCYPVSAARHASRPAPLPQRKPVRRPSPVPDVHVPSDRPYRLASRQHRTEDTRIQIGEVTLGGERPVLIAGPCSVESREQTRACAEAVALQGGHILRGGCFKPRTSPYSFQGLGYEGLDILQEAGRRHGLPIITEVMHPSDVEAVAAQADVLQIGARNMQNFALLKAIGQTDRPVMLKRGMMASIDEWLAAAEYILAHGNEQVFLCERGIRTFETATRNTLDLSAVPVVRERTHLPVIVDPAHACGERRWVQPLTEAALAAGAHGVMVEIHPNPEEALSDGPQSLPFADFEELAAAFRAA